MNSTTKKYAKLALALLCITGTQQQQAHAWAWTSPSTWSLPKIDFSSTVTTVANALKNNPKTTTAVAITGATLLAGFALYKHCTNSVESIQPGRHVCRIGNTVHSSWLFDAIHEAQQFDRERASNKQQQPKQEGQIQQPDHIIDPQPQSVVSNDEPDNKLTNESNNNNQVANNSREKIEGGSNNNNDNLIILPQTNQPSVLIENGVTKLVQLTEKYIEEIKGRIARSNKVKPLGESDQGFVVVNNKLDMEELITNLVNMADFVILQAKQNENDKRWLIVQLPQFKALIEELTELSDTWSNLLCRVANTGTLLYTNYLGKGLNRLTMVGLAKDRAYEFIGLDPHQRQAYSVQYIRSVISDLKAELTHALETTHLGDVLRQVEFTLANAEGKKLYDAWYADHGPAKKTQHFNETQNGHLAMLCINKDNARKWQIVPEETATIPCYKKPFEALIGYIEKETKK